MITFPPSPENLPDAFLSPVTSWSLRVGMSRPLTLWNFHSILVDPKSTPTQAWQAKRRMLEVLEAANIPRIRPMLVPVLNVPEPEERSALRPRPLSPSTLLSI